MAAFVLMMYNALGGSAEGAEQIASLIMAGAAVVGYTLAEGLADAGHKDGDE